MIVGSVYLIGAVIYAIFASGEKQKWADELGTKKTSGNCNQAVDEDENL